MSVEITGFEELGDLRDRLDSAGGEVPMTELFPPDFMTNYTEFEDFDQFLERSRWEIETQADFEEIPEDQFDEYVDERTGFDSWETMLSAAGREYVMRQVD
jgi:hypothetical protein